LTCTDGGSTVDVVRFDDLIPAKLFAVLNPSDRGREVEKGSGFMSVATHCECVLAVRP
jgi:hypothetical protein